MHTYNRTYIYHIYTFNLTINYMHTSKNTLQERSVCVIQEVLSINEIYSKSRFFRAIIVPWFCYHCYSKRLLIPLIAKHQILFSRICTRNKLEHLISKRGPVKYYRNSASAG